MLAVLMSGPASARTELPAEGFLVEPRHVNAEIHRLGHDAAARARSAVADADPEQALDVLDAVPDALARELAAAELIAALQDGEDTAAARTILVRLQSAPVRAFVRHEETAADWFLPLVDVPARARAALEVFELRREAQQWGEALRADSDAAMRRLASGEGFRIQAVRQALRQIDEAERADVIAAALKVADRLPSGAWSALAERQAEPRLLQAALAHADDPALLEVLAHARRFEASDRLAWLQAVRDQRPGLASAALLALAEHAPPDSAELAVLLEALDDPRHAPSAAAALAGRPFADRTDVLVTLAQQPMALPKLRAVALALRLEDSPRARAALRALAEHPDLPASLRGELLQ